MRPAIPPRRHAFGRAALACAAIALPVVVYFATAWVQEGIPISETAPGLQLVTAPIVQTPAIVPGRDANLGDETEVIGVSLADRHRAYVVEALVPMSRHVINDLLDDVPCTVSYCDRTDCVRVFTAPRETEPLAIAPGGFDSRSARGTMLLRVGSEHYRQDSGLPLADDGLAVFPYADLEFDRTTWGRWREAHPDSDVYVGH
jgi:hypothetical protein